MSCTMYVAKTKPLISFVHIFSNEAVQIAFKKLENNSLIKITEWGLGLIFTI